jgi:hypothetical protein
LVAAPKVKYTSKWASAPRIPRGNVLGPAPPRRLWNMPQFIPTVRYRKVNDGSKRDAVRLQ